ncbi:MAG TPA: hypothetical protein VIY48_21640 [Candidatus Paceibacterota bacterium]
MRITKRFFLTHVGIHYMVALAVSATLWLSNIALNWVEEVVISLTGH